MEEVKIMYTIKRFLVLTLVSFLTLSAAMADDAVFSNNAPTQNVELQPANSSVKAEIVNAVNNETPTQSLSNEKFKSAVNNIESAQVDIREQLASYKVLVDDQTLKVANEKTELARLKREYRALQKKMNNIEKMKKLLNNNIN